MYEWYIRAHSRQISCLLILLELILSDCSTIFLYCPCHPCASIGVSWFDSSPMKSTHMHYKALKPSEEVVRASQLSFIEWCSLFGVVLFSEFLLYKLATSSSNCLPCRLHRQLWWTLWEEEHRLPWEKRAWPRPRLIRETGGDSPQAVDSRKNLYSVSHLLTSSGGVLSRDCVISVWF